MQHGAEVTAARGVRVVRGLVTSGLAILVAAVCHLAGGGTTPGLVGVVLAVAFAVPACAFLAGRSVSPVRLTIAVAVSQGAFHLLFSVGAASTAAVRMVGGHHGSGGHLLASPGLDVPAGAVPAMHHDSGMQLAHVLAALLTSLALLFGERALWDLLALAGAGVAVVVAAAALAAAPRVELRHRVATARRLELRDLGVALSSMPRRGPPLPV